MTMASVAIKMAQMRTASSSIAFFVAAASLAASASLSGCKKEEKSAAQPAGQAPVAAASGAEKRPKRETHPMFRKRAEAAQRQYGLGQLGAELPAVGPSYCALPKPRIGKKITPKKARPSPNPTPLPKLLAKSMQRIIQIIKFTNGISIKRIHHHGLPTILHQI